MENHTTVKEFVLLGFCHLQEYYIELFFFFFSVYVLTLFGNTLVIVVTLKDPHLHTPMYFFLCNFSLIEMLIISTVVPRMLVDLAFKHNVISLAGCLTQSYLYFSLGSAEFLLLTAMALDRYVAICQPLRYVTIMSNRLCIGLVLASWITGFLSIISPTVQKSHLYFCGSNVINHLFCDSAPLLKLSCSDTHPIELTDFFMSLVFVVATLLLIIISYIYIIGAVFRIQSSSGRQKAFSTCASHLTVVVIGYGSTIFIYVRTDKNHVTDVNKIVFLITAVMTPFLNPFIFTFRNETVKEALRNVFKKSLLGPQQSRSLTNL